MQDLKDCAKLQQSEIEMLQSMFPDSSEFSIEKESLCELDKFINGSDSAPSRIDFTINLKTEKGKASLCVTFPSFYPKELPDLYVRSNDLSRKNQMELNTHLNEFLKTIEKGELVVGSTILWLQENADIYLNIKSIEESPAEKNSSEDGLTFIRMWIYSHHIYSKVKRKDIKDLAEEFDLSGFCLPGKPGIICVEGKSAAAKEWWQTVHSWNWQKILCKRIEEEKVESLSEISNLRRFQSFLELGSNSNIRVKSSGFHVNMGDLFNYLEDHSSGYMFEELFGVTGKKK